MKAVFYSLVITLALSALNLAYATQFYRWTNEKGELTIQSSIPPEYVSKGYEIVDGAGNIVKIVAPEISDAEKRENASAKISAEMQRARDLELLKLYRSPLDVDRTMKTWLSRMDMEVRVKKSRISIKENEYNGLQEKAAIQEKSGQEVDAELIAQMKTIQLIIEQFSLEIRQVELRQDESRNEFKIERDRMVELWELINQEEWLEPEE